MRVFVPIEEAVPARDVVLVPYRQGLPCEHGLRGGFVPDAAGWLEFRSAPPPRVAHAERMRDAETQSA